MSIPLILIKCNACRQRWTNRIQSGFYTYELPDGRLAYAAKDILWCYNCEDFCPVERFPDMEELEAKLATQQQQLEQVRSEKLEDKITFWFIRRPGQIDMECIRIYENSVADEQARIQWRKLRQSPRKFLSCGSMDILDQGDVFQTPQTHPGCGGTLEREEPQDISFAYRQMHRIYDVEGHFLREDVFKRRSAR